MLTFRIRVSRLSFGLTMSASPLFRPCPAALVASILFAAFLVGCDASLKPVAPAPPKVAAPGGGVAPSGAAAVPSTAAEPATPTSTAAESPAPKKFPGGPLKAPITLDESLLAEGWISLFDGETLFGWETLATECDWRVEEGAIVVSEGPAGLLCTTVPFADCELELEYKAPAETNAGVFMNVVGAGGSPATDCYEINVAPLENPFPTGSIVQRKKTESAVDAPADQWNAYRIVVDAGRVTIYLNGNLVCEYEDESPLPPGRIGLQHNTGAVAYRNVRVRPLGLAPILDESYPKGWKTFEGPAKFQWTDEGQLHVAGGKGRIESDGSYGDFVLQVEARTNAPALNSGVFFRCIPGEEMNGYEGQIQNAFKDGDRTKPVDCGTGGIFRRVDARWVASDDEAWLYQTIVADGPRIAVWVDGLQVTDWVDERAPDPNPRKGLRTEPGTIQLQAHDPTTDLDFRTLRVRSFDGE